ncbi:hypothetical protein LguiB_006389 [Lonicera macranthoides]
MALRSITPSPSAPSSSSSSSPSQSLLTSFFLNSRTALKASPIAPWRSKFVAFTRPGSASFRACVKLEEKNVPDTGSEWGKVSAVLFDMDGVLCNSEEPSRLAAVDVFAEMGVEVTVEDFVPFMGTGTKKEPYRQWRSQKFLPGGEANFLGGVASVKGVKGFNTEAAKKRFFEIYLDKYAKPNSGIGFPGALELITQCKNNGLKVAVASSADRIKVDANLAAAGLPLSMFDAIVSADVFENLKPAPDIFLAASKILNVPTSECIVIEDALAGVQAAKAAEMRCIAVTTTLSEDTLKAAGPSIIKKEIGNVSLDDILRGGSGFDNVMMQGPQPINYSAQTSPPLLEDTVSKSFQDAYSTSDATLSSEGNKRGLEEDEQDGIQGTGPLFKARDIAMIQRCVFNLCISVPICTSLELKLQGSRRDILRYGSLGIALSCLAFTITNWKTMQYASPTAIWNLLFGAGSPPFGQSEETSRSTRIQQFLNYISDLESKKTATIVPEFPSKLDWLNTAPLQLRRDLKGKVVLLDFWTYCCINCMHVLPDLEFLEEKYKDMPFTVVGVHSAKFDNEKDLDAIRNAVLRYGISHPVVNDGDMYLWRELGINSWPTFAIVGPNGKLLAQIAGEGRRKDLDDLVEAALLFYGRKKMLDNRPIPLSLEKDNDPRLLTSPLKFPGKLAVDVLNNRLFISDSNHNRIHDVITCLAVPTHANEFFTCALGAPRLIYPRARLCEVPVTKHDSIVGPLPNNLSFWVRWWLNSSIVVTDLAGNFLFQIGSTGEDGLRDGNFDEATFSRPQGLAYNTKRNVLYVADTENHALRVIDFVNELLNSPWDVCYEPANEIVYIAMAGQHQIWEHNTLDGVTRAFSGDGYERNLNGSSSTSTSFAQPSGISLSSDLKEAYIADSESSSIRALDLKTGGSRLLAGGDPIFSDNLFKFGDNDGVGSEVLLQHPLGVLCGKDGQIYFADSYNHKIKKLDPASRRVTALAGTGKAGFKDGAALAAQLSEPSGIVEAENGRFFIADTNNSVIRYIDLNKQEPELLTLELKGVQPPAPKSRSPKRLRRRSGADTEVVVVDGGSSNEGNLDLKISVSEGYHFSKEAQSKFSVEIEPENAATVDPLDGNLSPEGTAVLHFKRSSPSAFMGKIYCKEAVARGVLVPRTHRLGSKCLSWCENLQIPPNCHNASHGHQLARESGRHSLTLRLSFSEHYKNDNQRFRVILLRGLSYAMKRQRNGGMGCADPVMLWEQKFHRVEATLASAVYYCKEDEVCLYKSLAFEVPFQEASPDSTTPEAKITLSHVVKPKTSLPEGLQLPVVS